MSTLKCGFKLLLLDCYYIWFVIIIIAHLLMYTAYPSGNMIVCIQWFQINLKSSWQFNHIKHHGPIYEYEATKYLIGYYKNYSIVWEI